MKRTMLICLCASALALFPRASLAEIKGTPPNPAGDTVIDRDTVWRGEKITLGGDLVVQKGRSFTIDNCDVLFSAIWPKGKMTCGNNTTIGIKDSYIHGKGEKEYAERAAGLVLGGSADRLTVKISGTTFKYLGDGWSKGKTHDAMVTAPAHYTPDSYFRGNSLICDSKQKVWGFESIGRHASGTALERGIKVEDCYFFQTFQGVSYFRHLYGSTLRGCTEPINVPQAHFVIEGNRFYDNSGKSINCFNDSSRGSITDNFMYNTTICLVDLPGAADNLIKNNIMVGVESPYLGGRREQSGGGGIGDGNMFIGNEFIGFVGGAISIAGKNWLIAGNKITNCYGGTIGMHPWAEDQGGKLTGRAKSGGDAIIIGNRFERCYGGGLKGGVIQISRWPATPETYKWKGAVIAGNIIKDNLFYAPPRGIKLTNTENILIKNNSVTNNSIGVEISPEVINCKVIDNDISGNKTDIIGSPSGQEKFPEAKIISPSVNEFKKGQTVKFEGKVAAKGEKKIVSYWWFFGDDGTTSKEQNPTRTFKKDGKYFVALIVTDSAGLKDVAIMPGRIEAVWNQKDPKRPWPEKSPRLAVYPSPLYLSSNSNPTFVLYNYRGKPSLKICNADGKVVKEFEKFSMNAEGLDNFNIASLPTIKKTSVDFYECLVEWDKKEVPAGEYSAVASDEEGEIAKCKFVVR